MFLTPLPLPGYSKNVRVIDRGRRSEAKVLRLTTENSGLLRSNNKLGEENIKLKDTIAQLELRLEAKEKKRKEAEESFAHAAEKLEKKTADVKMLEDNYGKVYDNAYDTCTKGFEKQIPGVNQKIWAASWRRCLEKAWIHDDSSPLRLNPSSRGFGHSHDPY